jgi:hypothetical protein
MEGPRISQLYRPQDEDKAVDLSIVHPASGSGLVIKNSKCHRNAEVAEGQYARLYTSLPLLREYTEAIGPVRTSTRVSDAHQGLKRGFKQI